MAPAGRPKLGVEKRERYNVMLEPKVAEYIRGLALGNLSAGVNRLVSWHLEGKVPKRKRANNQGEK